MVAVGDVISEIFPAAARTAHRLTDLVHGAQVEDERILRLDDLAAELTHELQA